MTTIQIVFGILLLVMAVFLVVAVLLQSGKDSKLSGTIAGGADTFFGKSKSASKDKVLSLITAIVAVVFVVIVVLMFILV